MRRTIRVLGASLVFLFGFAACSAQVGTQTTTTGSLPPLQVATSSSTLGLPPASCEPDLLHPTGDAQASGEEIEVWALFFATHQGLAGGEPVFVPEGEEIKIVWRATGAGDAAFRAIGPNGSVVSPIWGPDPHLDSSWDTHPGDEWGTGWVFPEPGCWSVEVRRGDGVAYLDIDIRA